MTNQNLFNPPVYVFRSVPKSITILLSDRIGDWGSFKSLQEAKNYVDTFKRFSYLWLRKRGYTDISYRIVPRYDLRSQSYGYNPKNLEEQLREAILADMLSPSNWGLPMSSWKGVSDNSPNIKSFTDYGK